MHKILNSFLNFVCSKCHVSFCLEGIYLPIHSSIHPFNRFLLSVYSVPGLGTVLGPGHSYDELARQGLPEATCCPLNDSTLQNASLIGKDGASISIQIVVRDFFFL